MIELTISLHELRAAPSEVRRWVEQKLRDALDDHETGEGINQDHLVACTMAEAETLLSRIQTSIPVVNVFFELGRAGKVVASGDVAILRLSDMAADTRLARLDALMQCLSMINSEFKQIRKDQTASLFGLDELGNCYVPVVTQQNVRALWRNVSQQIDPQGASPEPQADLEANPRAAQ